MDLNYLREADERVKDRHIKLWLAGNMLHATPCCVASEEISNENKPLVFFPWHSRDRTQQQLFQRIAVYLWRPTV